MFSRCFLRPDKSFFLLGPRGTGKSTWLKEYKFDLSIDLLSSRDLLYYKSAPARLFDTAGHLAPNSWVLIDEVQKVPELLDEVQRLYEEKRLNFALSGSSARKLKRHGANLLAGRAINVDIFPLCYAEYKNNLPLDIRIKWGTIPLFVDNLSYIEDTALSYVHNYLRQEIAEEGLVRKLDIFTRFLPSAALSHGKMLSYQAVSENCAVARSTVIQYFEILFDTLVAFKLPAWQPHLKVKEIKTPKFYLFDSGLAHACLGLQSEVDRSYLGYCLEGMILNELKAYISYFKRRKDLYYYSISDSFEVDIIVDLGVVNGKREIAAIEVKLSENWNPRWNDGLNALRADPRIRVKSAIGIYTGAKRISFDKIDVYPVDQFLSALFEGAIF